MPLLKLGEKRYYLGIFFKVRADSATWWNANYAHVFRVIPLEIRSVESGF
jgi:hypothetical protein